MSEVPLWSTNDTLLQYLTPTPLVDVHTFVSVRA